MDRFADRLPIPASYFELVLRQFATTAFLRNEILAGTGVAPDQDFGPGSEITVGQLLQALRNLNRIRPGGWALSVGVAFHAATHGALGFAAISAPTLGEALDLVARFTHVRNPSHRAETDERDGESRLALIEQVALAMEERIPLVETFLLSIQGLVESVVGQPFSEGRFEFGYPAPAWADRYRDVFHGEVRFGEPCSALVIPSPLRALRSPHVDPVRLLPRCPPSRPWRAAWKAWM